MANTDELQSIWVRIAEAEKELAALQTEIDGIRAAAVKLGSVCDPALSESVRILDLPVKTFTCLRNGCIRTIAELVVAYREGELMNLRNFGPVSLCAIEEALGSKGLLSNEVYSEALFLVRHDWEKTKRTEDE